MTHAARCPCISVLSMVPTTHPAYTTCAQSAGTGKPNARSAKHAGSHRAMARHANKPPTTPAGFILSDVSNMPLRRTTCWIPPPLPLRRHPLGDSSSALTDDMPLSAPTTAPLSTGGSQCASVRHLLSAPPPPAPPCRPGLPSAAPSAPHSKLLSYPSSVSHIHVSTELPCA